VASELRGVDRRAVLLHERGGSARPAPAPIEERGLRVVEHRPRPPTFDCHRATPLSIGKKSPAIFLLPRHARGGKKRGFCRPPRRVATPGPVVFASPPYL